MARRNRDDLCLICFESPCKCNKPATPKKILPPKVAAPKPEAVSVTPPVATWTPPVVTPTRRVGLSGLKRTVVEKVPVAPSVEDDAEMRRAVTVLVQSGLVAEVSIKEHRGLIDLTDAQIRAVLWKQKRGGGNDNRERNG